MHWRAVQPGTEAGAAGAHRGGPEWLQVVRELDKEDLALLVQFVTGTSKVPLDGFKALQVCPCAPSLLMLSTKCSDKAQHTPAALVDLALADECYILSRYCHGSDPMHNHTGLSSGRAA